LPRSSPKAWLPLPALQRQGGAVTQHELGATTMEITTVGIDLAKNVFQVVRMGCLAHFRGPPPARFRLPPCLVFISPVTTACAPSLTVTC
jgi:hypothetical protein